MDSTADISVNGITVGKGAGAVATNTAVGASALEANTTGTGAVAVGYEALKLNTTASNNTAVGYQAGYSNTEGAELTAIGRKAALSNTTGNYNTALGLNSLFTNTTGSSNTALGVQSLNSNTTASNNTAVGYRAGYSGTTGANGAYFGYLAGNANQTTNGNTMLGAYSGRYATGGLNTFVGQGSGENITTGVSNTILGRYNGNQNGLDIRTSSNNIVLSDGDGNPRGIFDGSGSLLIGKTAASIANAGVEIRQNDAPIFTQNGVCLYINRITTNGTLIEFRQDNVTEGTISVSGTTVSYNGGHLSRWAQTTTAKDESLVKGTVLSNLDEMNVYTDADGNAVDNEQLNKVKVSDVEGDANVAGVFVNWELDEDHNVYEINMAMTGDMIIRIAQGTTVARGDLLMSAGDGTAKPQGDDIVRSKTIAKVTSTNVTCTYEDGSYCVPCVLMAC